MAIRSPCWARTTRRRAASCARSCPARGRVEVLDARTGDPLGSLEPSHRPACSSGLLSPAARPICCASTGRGGAGDRGSLFVRPCCSATSTCICSPRAGTTISAACSARNAMTVDGVRGVRFAVWAPNASASRWSATSTPGTGAAIRCGCGTAPACGSCSSRACSPGARYKYEIVGAGRRAAAAEGRSAGAGDRDAARRPARSSPTPRRFAGTTRTGWQRARRGRRRDAPISIYEVHAASWLRARMPGNRPDWDALAERLVPYVERLGFTHLELLPIMEHPFGGSWGYQPLGLFAPSAPLRPAGGVRPLRRSLPRAGHRRDPRLGAGAFPDRRARPRPLRRHARSTSMPIRARDFITTGTPTSTISAATRCAGFLIAQRAALAGELSRRRTARGCGGLDALPRLQPQGGRVDSEQLWRPGESRSGRVPAASSTRAVAERCPGRR